MATQEDTAEVEEGIDGGQTDVGSQEIAPQEGVEGAAETQESKTARQTQRTVPRRIFLPDNGQGGQNPVNVQFVQGQAPPPKLPPKKKLSAFEQATVNATDDWERDAAQLADTIRWTLERNGPRIWQGRKVPCGTFPTEFSGKITIPVIGEIAGGGIYYAKYDDPKTGKTKKVGPFEVAGAPRFNIGVNEEEEGDPGMDLSLPMDFRVASQSRSKDEPEEWINTYDQRFGWMKRKRSDVEREGRAMQSEPQLESLKIQMQAQADNIKLQIQAQNDAMKRQSEDIKTFMQAILTQQNATPKEDPAAKWLEIERLRLQADKESKTEELQYLREKMAADQSALEAKLDHEKEIADTKLEAERLRAETEKRTLEARLEAERDRITSEKEALETRLADSQKFANDKLEKAHDTMMSMVREKSNPMDQVGSIFGLFREFNEVMSTDKDEDDGVTKGSAPKTRLDKFLDLVTSAAQRAIPTLEPLAQRAVKNYMDSQEQAQLQQQPQPQRIALRQPQQHKSPKATPAPEAEGVVSATEDPTQEETASGIGKMLADVSSAIDRNIAPSVAWNSLVEEQPLYALQLKAYTTPDHMASELVAVANTPGFEEYSKVLTEVAKKITGVKRKWAEDFLAVVQKAK